MLNNFLNTLNSYFDNHYQMVWELLSVQGLEVWAKFQLMLSSPHWLNFGQRLFFCWLSFVILGFCFLFFFRPQLLNISSYMRVDFRSGLLGGTAGLILTPLAIAALCATVLGLFLLPLVLFMYVLLLFFAFYSAALLLGEFLMRIFTFRDHIYLELFLGVTILFFGVFIPYVGILLFLFCLLLGMGGVINTRFGAGD